MLLPRIVREVKESGKAAPHMQISRTALWIRLAMMLAVAASGFGLMSIRSRGAAATGTISGTVFKDYNGNGVRDVSPQIPNDGGGNVGVANDAGVPGVTITAYTSTNAVAGSAVSDANGAYSINTAGSTGPYRVEFTNLPAGYFSTRFSSSSGTSVQFVPDGSSSNINLGIVHPADHSQNNPSMVVPRYVEGPNTGTEASIVAFPYSAGTSSENPNTPTSEFDQPAFTTVAAANQVGTTWGLAWSKGEQRLYAAAFTKRYAGYGPAGTGGIYRINPTTQAVTTYADLNAIFGAGTAGVSTHNFADPYDGGNATWNAVGKVALGGAAISDDGTKLFVMNLANRTLYELPIGVAPTAVNIRTSAVPLSPPSCPAAGDVRPFAVTYHRGLVYVGITCTAESTTAGGTVAGDPTQLRAYIYTVDPATLAFSAAPVFQVPLNYPRTCADSAQLPVCNSALWKPWSPIYNNIAEINPPPPFVARVVYPQPWLTSIEFDRGNLVLGIRDRLGDQTGLRSPDNPNRPIESLYFGVGAGDILRACGNPGSGWTLESNGRCAGIGTAPQGTGEGPGNAEYYWRDDSPIFNDETANGGQAQVPGFPDVLAGVIHPVPYVPNSNDDTIFDAGIRWFVNNTGAFSKNYRIINDDLATAQFFGKANGLGDIVALVEQPVSEIGNFVWYDSNMNGRQDPGEAPIAGVTVRLFQGAVQVGQTTTNAAGQYYFNSSNVTGGILAGTAYEIRISLADAALGGLVPTIPNAGSDIHDSDGIPIGGNSVATASVPILGANDHSFDFGFTDLVTDADLEIRKRVAQNCVEPGQNVTYTVTVTNLGPAVATGVIVTDDLPFALQVQSVTPSQGSCNNLDPMTCNLGTLGVQQSATITIIMSIPANPPVNTFTNTATVSANEPDPNPLNNKASATACLIVPGDPNTPVGPGDPYEAGGAINDQKPGSVLFFNYYTSNPSTPNLQNTQISLTNTNVAQYIFMHLFFVDGQTCTVSDRYVCLTKNQTLSFLASDQDPGVTGYMVAIAVDDVLGCPIEFNHVIGDAFIKTFDGHHANLLAEAIAKIPGETAATCNAGSSTALLLFNGTPGNYEQVPRVLAASSVQDYSAGNRALLIINRFGGNFQTSAFTLPTLFGILYNDEEDPASFIIPENGCQVARVLSDDFPITVPRFATHVGPGQSGWLKFFSPTDIGIMGSIINFNANTQVSSEAFNQGRNLHKLKLTASETIVKPVFPPN